MKRFACFLLLGALLTGCATLSTRQLPQTDLRQPTRFFVVHRLADDRRIDLLIVAELERLGRIASSGPITMLPDDAEIVVSYEDRWAWDFGTYLVELSMDFRRAKTDKPLASAYYHRAIISRQAPITTVRAMLDPLLAGTAKIDAAPPPLSRADVRR